MLIKIFLCRKKCLCDDKGNEKVFFLLETASTTALLHFKLDFCLLRYGY